MATCILTLEFLNVCGYMFFFWHERLWSCGLTDVLFQVDPDSLNAECTLKRHVMQLKGNTTTLIWSCKLLLCMPETEGPVSQAMFLLATLPSLVLPYCALHILFTRVTWGLPLELTRHTFSCPAKLPGKTRAQICPLKFGLGGKWVVFWQMCA